MPARDRDAVPLVEPVQHDLVAGVFERLHRELRGRALDLLHREDVDALPHEPVGDASHSAAHGVHIPSRKAHDLSLVSVSDARAALIQHITDGAVFHGDFTLTSGKKATYYIDLRKVSLDGRVAPLIGEVMADLVDGIPDVVAVGGLTMGADPIAAAVLHQSAARGKPYDAFVVRKEPKDHGRGRQVEGPDLEGKRVVVLEDTSTTGGSPLKAIEALLKVGAEIAAVAVVVDRDTGAKEVIEAAGYPYYAAISLQDLGLQKQ